MIIAAKPLSAGVWAAPQIATDDLPELARQGIRRIVSHRPDGEDPDQPSAADISAAATSAGLEFVHAPVTGMPGPDAVKATADALEDGVPVLMFCRSGTRSTIAWALAMRSLDRADPDTLRQTAAAAGYDLSRLPL